MKPEILIVNKALPPENKDINFGLFWEVWNKLEKEYLDEAAVNKQKMFYGAISGLTASLGDPYTVFLPPQKQEESKEELAGEFGGVGIQLGFKEDRLVVIAPLDDTPAKLAGIEAGDFILRIKDEKKEIDRETDGITLPEAVDIIRGQKGDPVVLTIFRGKQKPFEVSLKRDTILVKSVEVEFVDWPLDGDNSVNKKTVAVIRLSRFGDRTVSEWNKAVDKIIKTANDKKDNFGGMVLDVRNNPGGYLEAAIAISSEFFRDGTVVEQKGKITSHPFNVERPGKLIDMPLIVLINEGSASASEIVAGAIQARNRGELVGKNTFGKGTVQDAMELTGGAGLHITTARWLLPNGNWIHDEGLKPDVEIDYDQEASKDQKWDNQMKKAMEVLVKG
ncbi:S41 family peptidase [Candidatus Collierbacteria bacterium]|nr:S41 family peptidase [Candidatus Collierbacteria bacterium]